MYKTPHYGKARNAGSKESCSSYITGDLMERLKECSVSPFLKLWDSLGTVTCVTFYVSRNVSS